jgi:peptidoglycan/LPS O-acetylase OafA/YrhL
MSRTAVLRPSRRDARVLAGLAWAIAALGTLKYLALAIEGGIARSPWGFALVLVLPFVVGALALASRRRLGAAVIGLFAAVFAVVCAVAVSEGVSPHDYWADLVLILVGGPLALLALGLSVRVLTGR